MLVIIAVRKLLQKTPRSTISSRNTKEANTLKTILKLVASFVTALNPERLMRKLRLSC